MTTRVTNTASTTKLESCSRVVDPSSSETPGKCVQEDCVRRAFSPVRAPSLQRPVLPLVDAAPRGVARAPYRPAAGTYCCWLLPPAAERGDRIGRAPSLCRLCTETNAVLDQRTQGRGPIASWRHLLLISGSSTGANSIAGSSCNCHWQPVHGGSAQCSWPQGWPGDLAVAAQPRAATHWVQASTIIKCEAVAHNCNCQPE